jgi:hypothetical protein
MSFTASVTSDDLRFAVSSGDFSDGLQNNSSSGSVLPERGIQANKSLKNCCSVMEPNPENRTIGGMVLFAFFGP